MTVLNKILEQLGWLAGLATLMPPGSGGVLAERLRLSRAEGRCLARLDVGISHDELILLGGQDGSRVPIISVNSQRCFL